MSDNNNDPNSGGGGGAFEWLASGFRFGKQHQQQNSNNKNSENDDNNNNTDKKDLSIQTLMNETFLSLKEFTNIMDNNESNDRKKNKMKDENNNNQNEVDDGDEVMEDGDSGCNDNDNTNEETIDVLTNLISDHLSSIRFLLYNERKRTIALFRRRRGQQPTEQYDILNIIPTISYVIRFVTSDNENNNNDDFIPLLLTCLGKLPFETRKDVSSIFNYLLVCGLVDNNNNNSKSSSGGRRENNNNDSFDYDENDISSNYNNPTTMTTATRKTATSDSVLYLPIMNDFVSYIQKNFDKVMIPIIDGHNTNKTSSSLPDVALYCGSMLRSMIRHLSLYETLVSSTDHVTRYIFPFLDIFVHSPNFDVSSDASDTLRIILNGGCCDGNSSNDNNQQGQEQKQSNTAFEEQQKFQQLASAFMLRDYVELFDKRYNLLLLPPSSTTTTTTTATTAANSDINTAGGQSQQQPQQQANYMTRRMALQTLSTILLKHCNYDIMIKYISDKRNLIIIMKLLRSTSPHITLEAFHVFKIFVANPNKPNDIVKILYDNKIKLCAYLKTLHKEREVNDVQFRDEKTLIISTLESLQV